MKPWWRDTLAKRLFVLMWAALVVSHLAAWWLVTQWVAPPGHGMRPPDLPSMNGLPGPPPPPPPAHAHAHAQAQAPHRRLSSPSHTPTFPSLPPTPGVPQVVSMGPGPGPENSTALPTTLLLLDYGTRVLVIGLAAWLGARWLAAPVRRLVGASRALAQGLNAAQPPPQLHERGATVEVQEAAQVFNQMAQQLHAQFRSRGLLMAAVSHDLRTPLTRMRIRLESLKDQPGVQRCIEDIHEMDALVDTALQVFRDHPVDEPLQATDLFALVQSMTDDLQEQSAPVTLQGQPVVVQARVAALRRVLDNLLSNAVRYGQRADVRVLTETVSTGVDAVVWIDDHGPGIPAVELVRVFEPFYRLEASRNRANGGTGLGLHIARDLLQRQGGSLRLVNRPEGGLRAELRMPAQATGNNFPAPAPNSPKRPDTPRQGS